MSAVDAKTTLNRLFDSFYEIHDHSVRSKAFSVNAMHDTVKLKDHNGLKRAAVEYISSGIKDVFGISLTDWLKLPGTTCDILKEVAKKPTNDEQKRLMDLEREIKKTIR